MTDACICNTGYGMNLSCPLHKPDPRVGQPPLDPAHPGWTLPIPPDAPTLSDEADRNALVESVIDTVRDFHVCNRECIACFNNLSDAVWRVLKPYFGGALPPDRPTPEP